MAWLTPLHPSNVVVETSPFYGRVFFASMVDVVYTDERDRIGRGSVMVWGDIAHE